MDQNDPGEMHYFKRHAKGNVTILECDPAGKYIILVNTSESVSEDVSHYEIRRIIDGTHVVTFHFPSDTVIQPHNQLEIYGKNAGGVHSPPDSIVMESYPSWGQGAVVETLLFNSRTGMEKASYILTKKETPSSSPVEMDHYDQGEKDHYDSGEMQTTFKRHAKGNVSIVESDPAGKYIILENTSESVSEDVSHYEIRRIIDGTRQVFTFHLPSETVIHPQGVLKIYGKNAGGVHSPPHSIVMESYPSWGQGAVVETLLFNSHGILKASHIQTTVASFRRETPIF